MNVSNIYSIVFCLIIFLNLSQGNPQDDESIVPEDIEDGSIIDEDEVSTKGGAQKLSPLAVEEYMQEHPEVKQMPTPGGDGKPGKTKRVYNKFGDVVSIPDTSAEKPKETKKPKQSGQMLLPMPPNANPYPYPFPNPYAMNPYFNNQFPIQPQQQIFSMQMPTFSQQPPLPGTPVTMQELANYNLTPRTGQEDQTKSETELNEKIFQIMRSQQMAQQMPVNNKNGTTNGPNVPFPNLRQLPMMQPFMPPFPQPYPPFPQQYNPNQFKVDNKNIKIMPFPNTPGMDPNLLKQLQSGSAQLDVANAKVVPLDLEPTTETPIPMTESESLDERPELPEVIIPVTTPKPRIKHRRKGKRMQRRHPRHRHRHELRKPHFLMRARLNKLPKKGEKGGDEWWTKPVPTYCNETIVEITTCKEKHLEKRWSFNEADEKCYLYEDLCYKVKKNTFKSLKDCMIACWRPK